MGMHRTYFYNFEMLKKGAIAPHLLLVVTVNRIVETRDLYRL